MSEAPFVSNIQLGVVAEVPGESSSKRSHGRLAAIGHFHEKVIPQHFIKLIFRPILGVRHIPANFVESFGAIPEKIKVITNTGCNWMMNTKYNADGRPIIDQGWAAFAIVHGIKMGYFLTFKREAPGIYRVVIFDHSACEVMTRCPDHGKATRMIINVKDA